MLITSPGMEIIENLWILGTAEYPVFCFRDGGECVIFEAGVSAVAPVVAQQMEALDIDRDSVTQAVITHAHPDHVMAVPLFRDLFPNITVLASEAATGTLDAEKAVSFFCKVDEALAASLRKSEVITEAERARQPAEMRIPVDRTIKEGDTVTAGGASFTVLETPGHSDCSLSFYEAGRKTLIVSDATGYYMPGHDFWWPNYFTGYASYLDSIRRLAGMDAEVLCLSHNAAIKGAEDVEAYFNNTISATEGYHQRIVDEVKSGRPARELAEQLGADVYAKTQLLPLDFFQKSCSLLIKQSLQHEGLGAEE